MEHVLKYLEELLKDYVTEEDELREEKFEAQIEGDETGYLIAATRREAVTMFISELQTLKKMIKDD